MNFMSRLLSGFLVFTALLFICASLSLDWLIEVGVVADPFGRLASLLEMERKAEQITRQIQASIEKVRAKDQIAEALTNGELSLFEAAARFRALYEDPKSWHHPHLPRPERQDGITWCREVINWTDNTVRIESPCEADAVRQRLEAELDHELAYHGHVKMPE